MIKTIKTIYQEGKVKLPEDTEIPENATIFISYSDEDELDSEILGSSESYLDKIWDNTEDDIYERLLNK